MNILSLFLRNKYIFVYKSSLNHKLTIKKLLFQTFFADRLTTRQDFIKISPFFSLTIGTYLF